LRYIDGANTYQFVESNPAGMVGLSGIISPDRGLPLRPHQPGGPLEPPKGKEVRCIDDDTCATLPGETMILIAVLASHEAWDISHQSPAHGLGRHAVERRDCGRAPGRSLGLYTKKGRERQIRPAPPSPAWPGIRIHPPPPPAAPAVGAVVVMVLLVIILSPVGG
jgi:hypothetical protein